MQVNKNGFGVRNLCSENRGPHQVENASYNFAHGLGFPVQGKIVSPSIYFPPTGRQTAAIGCAWSARTMRSTSLLGTLRSFPPACFHENVMFVHPAIMNPVRRDRGALN